MTINKMENRIGLFVKTSFIVVVLAGLISWNPISRASDSAVNEDFFVFFQEFCTIEGFQKARIDFPLKEVILSEDLNDKEESEVGEEDWRFIRIKEFKTNIVEQYFNSFSKKRMEDSDEMVFYVGGIENGINVRYYFSRLDGKWYLVKIEDFTT